MLFDLQGKRRRGIQVVYTLLAVIMVGGLVLFGIGGAVSGGLVNAFQTNGTSYDDTAKKVEEDLKARPGDAVLIQRLIEAKYQVAVEQSGSAGFSAEGRKTLASVPALWTRYQATKKTPPESLLNLLVQVFSTEALNKPTDAANVAGQLAEIKPSAQTFYQVSYLASLAGQTRRAKLTRAEAYKYAENKEERASLKAAFAQVDQQVAAQAASSSGTTTTTKPSPFGGSNLPTTSSP